MDSPGISHHIIENVAGCGCFQALVVFLVFWVGRLAMVFSVSFISFAIYNPGWRCLDENITQPTTLHDSTAGNNLTYTTNVTFSTQYLGNDSSSSDFVKDNCPIYKACSNVMFNPDASTLISEWGLMCDDAWIVPLIISLQMVGVLVGSPIAGQLGDTFGRKLSFYGSLVIIGVMNALAIFSNSWQMYAAIRFFLGIGLAGHMSLTYPFIAEFSTMKWRASIAGIPAWTTMAVICSVVVMVTKDWRQIHLITVVLAIVGFLPVFWIPESLRFLEVKNKTGEFVKAAEKMTKLNGKTLPPIESLTTNSDVKNVSKKDPKIYAIIDLFRPGYRANTLFLGLLTFSNNLWYYVISYGVGTLSGDFYMNNIITYASGIPLQIFPLLAPHVLGRKVSGFAFVGTSTFCFLLSAGFVLSAESSLQTMGVRISILFANAAVVGNYCVVLAQTAEIYPTVVRSIGQSWCALIARIGAAVAPFLIPTNPETHYISYGIMGGFGLLCLGAISKLPETKGILLKQTFNDCNNGTPVKNGYSYEAETTTKSAMV